MLLYNYPANSHMHHCSRNAHLHAARIESTIILDATYEVERDNPGAARRALVLLGTAFGDELQRRELFP